MLSGSCTRAQRVPAIYQQLSTQQTRPVSQAGVFGAACQQPVQASPTTQLPAPWSEHGEDGAGTQHQPLFRQSRWPSPWPMGSRYAGQICQRLGEQNPPAAVQAEVSDPGRSIAPSSRGVSSGASRTPASSSTAGTSRTSASSATAGTSLPVSRGPASGGVAPPTPPPDPSIPPMPEALPAVVPPPVPSTPPVPISPPVPIAPPKPPSLGLLRPPPQPSASAAMLATAIAVPLMVPLAGMHLGFTAAARP